MSLIKTVKEFFITDPTTGKRATVDELGHLDVIAHAHAEGGLFHFVSGSLSADQDFIVIDKSDTTNYPHDNTGWLHSGWFLLKIDADSAAAYTIRLGFLANVDATNGDFIEVHRLAATKQTGNQVFAFFPMDPHGAKMRASSMVSSINDLNDTAFQTDVNLATTIDPSTADTPSGDGDMVLRVEITAGNIDITLDGAYHSHE